jgi:hypothetical protein
MRKRPKAMARSPGDGSSREGYPISEGEGGTEVVQAAFPVKKEVPVGGESRPIQGHGIHGHSPVKEDGRGVEESAQEEGVHAPKVEFKGRSQGYESVGESLGQGGR